MRRFLLFTCCFIAINCFSQNRFTSTAGTNKYDRLFSTIQSSDGNYVAAGYSQLKDINGDAYIVKIGTNGQLLWKTIIGDGSVYDNAEAIVNTNDEGFAVCGVINNTMALLKFKVDGTLQWKKEYDDFNYSEGTALLQETNGDYVMGGYIFSSDIPGHQNSYIVKTKGYGNVVWSKKYFDVSYSSISDLKITSDNKYVFLSINTNGSSDSTYIVKTDTSGNVLWSRSFYADNKNVDGYSVLPASDGGYLITGSASDASGSFLSDGFMIKLDKNGNLLWSKSTTEISNSSIYLATAVETSDGGYIAAGDHSLGGDNFYYLLKVNSSGVLQWTKTIAKNSLGTIKSLIKTNDNGYLASGNYATQDVTDLYNYFFMKLDFNANSCSAQNSFGSLQNFGTLANASIPTYEVNTTINNYSAKTASSGTATNICSALPVHLISFDAVLKNNTVQLQWQTAQEINTAYFTIEKSRDGKSFTGFKQVTASGNSSSVISYTATDNNPLPGKSWYRLKIVDKDGTASYSNIAPIENIIGDLIAIMPNPAISTLNVRIENSGNSKATFVITDENGKVLMQKNVALSQGSNNITFNVDQFANGVYTIKIIADKYTKDLKWIKE